MTKITRYSFLAIIPLFIASVLTGSAWAGGKVMFQCTDDSYGYTSNTLVILDFDKNEITGTGIKPLITDWSLASDTRFDPMQIRIYDNGKWTKNLMVYGLSHTLPNIVTVISLVSFELDSRDLECDPNIEQTCEVQKGFTINLGRGCVIVSQ